MAATDAARQAILDKIKSEVEDLQTPDEALMVLRLAEAFAWLTAQSQPHGGSASTSS